MMWRIWLKNGDLWKAKSIELLMGFVECTDVVMNINGTTHKVSVAIVPAGEIEYIEIGGGEE